MKKWYIVVQLTNKRKHCCIVEDDTVELETLRVKIAIMMAMSGYIPGSIRLFEEENHRLVDSLPLGIPRTKGELAAILLKGFQWDCALPEQWLEGYSHGQYDRRQMALSRFVWLYDSTAPQTGRPFDLLGFDKPNPGLTPITEHKSSYDDQILLKVP